MTEYALNPGCDWKIGGRTLLRPLCELPLRHPYRCYSPCVRTLGGPFSGRPLSLAAHPRALSSPATTLTHPLSGDPSRQGDGRVTFRYASDAASVLAVDPDEERIEKARAALKPELSSKITFVVAGAAEIDAPRESFDMALFSSSL